MTKGVAFEQTAKRMESMTPQQRQAAIDADSPLCICPACPSYVGTEETEVLFCLRGKSQVLTVDKGCICPDCPLTRGWTMRLKDYCFKGSGEEQLLHEAQPR